MLIYGMVATSAFYYLAVKLSNTPAMKHTILILSIVSIALLGSSCQKDYHCGCTNTTNNSTLFYTITAGSQAEAANECLLKSDSTKDCTL